MASALTKPRKVLEARPSPPSLPELCRDTPGKPAVLPGRVWEGLGVLAKQSDAMSNDAAGWSEFHRPYSYWIMRIESRAWYLPRKLFVRIFTRGPRNLVSDQPRVIVRVWVVMASAMPSNQLSFQIIGSIHMLSGHLEEV